MEIFHGTRQLFDKFDYSYKGTGESGDIDACWFADNFEGAKNHALYKNRNKGQPLVYRCELSSRAVIANHRKPLSEQNEIRDSLLKVLPVSLSTTIKPGCEWFKLASPCYREVEGRLRYFSQDSYPVTESELISYYSISGIHGVYDWEGIFTDAYIRGTTIIIFDFSCLTIKEIIEV